MQEFSGFYTGEGSKVEKKDGMFYCPVKDANLESSDAVCNMCISEQLEFKSFKG